MKGFRQACADNVKPLVAEFLKKYPMVDEMDIRKLVEPACLDMLREGQQNKVEMEDNDTKPVVGKE